MPREKILPPVWPPHDPERPPGAGFWPEREKYTDEPAREPGGPSVSPPTPEQQRRKEWAELARLAPGATPTRVPLVKIPGTVAYELNQLMPIIRTEQNVERLREIFLMVIHSKAREGVTIGGDVISITSKAPAAPAAAPKPSAPTPTKPRPPAYSAPLPPVESLERLRSAGLLSEADFGSLIRGLEAAGEGRGTGYAKDIGGWRDYQKRTGALRGIPTDSELAKIWRYVTQIDDHLQGKSLGKDLEQDLTGMLQDLRQRISQTEEDLKTPGLSTALHEKLTGRLMTLQQRAIEVQEDLRGGEMGENLRQTLTAQLEDLQQRLEQIEVAKARRTGQAETPPPEMEPEPAKPVYGPQPYVKKGASDFVPPPPKRVVGRITPEKMIKWEMAAKDAETADDMRRLILGIMMAAEGMPVYKVRREHLEQLFPISEQPTLWQLRTRIMLLEDELETMVDDQPEDERYTPETGILAQQETADSDTLVAQAANQLADQIADQLESSEAGGTPEDVSMETDDEQGTLWIVTKPELQKEDETTLRAALAMPDSRLAKNVDDAVATEAYRPKNPPSEWTVEVIPPQTLIISFKV